MSVQSKIISEAWGWTGIHPREIVAQNPFGNLLVEDQAGGYWRICPEQLSCTLVANDSRELEKLKGDQEFQIDWEMANLATDAIAKLGDPGEGKCFCLKIPAVLGGEYSMENIGHISAAELIGSSGYLAEQVKDVPDGTPIEIEIVD